MAVCGMELACPFCTGRWQVEPTGSSYTTTCPHCGRPVTVPALPPAPPPPRPPSATPPPPRPPSATSPPPIVPPELPRISPAPAPQKPAARSTPVAKPPIEAPAPIIEIRQAEKPAEEPPAQKAEPPAEPALPYAVQDRDPTIVNRRGEAIPLRRRTPEEQQRYRRRMNLLYALAGLLVLVFAVAVLLHVQP